MIICNAMQLGFRERRSIDCAARSIGYVDLNWICKRKQGPWIRIAYVICIAMNFFILRYVYCTEHVNENITFNSFKMTHFLSKVLNSSNILISLVVIYLLSIDAPYWSILQLLFIYTRAAIWALWMVTGKGGFQALVREEGQKSCTV